MKYFIICLVSLLGVSACLSPREKRTNLASGAVVIDVDPSHFLTNSSHLKISKVNCTLSDGTSTLCLQIVSTGNPTDHEMGPWCPNNIEDGAEAGGIWLENGKVYDVDGEFIKNMASFYGDEKWHMYDENGDVFVTETQEDCENAANPRVGPEYANFCVECLPAYVENISQTYLIPIRPSILEEPATFGMGGPGGPGGGKRPEGPPPGKRPENGPPGQRPPGRDRGLSVRGLAFNGIRFDAPAPTDAILGAYTLAPFDDAGGHINMGAGYHYHAATGVSTQLPQSDGHAAMIGYAMDGHGMYAHLDANGEEATGLDDCRGHYDEVRGYHYHVDAPGENNFLNCLQGAYAK